MNRFTQASMGWPASHDKQAKQRFVECGTQAAPRIVAVAQKRRDIQGSLDGLRNLYAERRCVHQNKVLERAILNQRDVLRRVVTS